MNAILFNLNFTPECLKAALLVSLLSVAVLVSLFFYLNRYTKRRYFSIWIAGWLFYALWLTLNLIDIRGNTQLVLMLKQWCLSTTAVFLIWGSANFLQIQSRQILIGLFIGFLFTWSYVGAYHLEHSLQAQLPIFGLIGVASFMTGISFFRFRRNENYLGAGLLAFGFCAWGIYFAAYPFAGNTESLISAGFFSSAVLQMFIAVSMVILVLEETRSTNENLTTRIASTERRYRSLFEQASEAIIIADPETLKIVELNPSAERLLGVKPSEKSKPSLEKFCQFTVANAPDKASASVWFEFLCHQHQVNVVHRDGTIRLTEVSASTIVFDGSAACQFVFRELTERARLENQLRQSEKLCALGRMISGIAHELNNPLATIKGYLDLILTKRKFNADMWTDLETVAGEANRAAKLVNNFLSFAREQPLQSKIIDLNEMVRACGTARKMEFENAKTELVFELKSDLPKMNGDPDQIQQVLLNLISNSLHALSRSTSPRRVKVSTQQKDKMLELVIEDSGPGVPDHLVSKIFEPFFTTKETGVGTGLGLSIAHSIVLNHQGRLFYQRAKIGGAGFVLQFLIADVQENSAPVDAGDELASTLKVTPGRILVVDDEKPLAELLGELLTFSGHSVVICNSAVDALQVLEKEAFDLILSDYRMPVMDGREFYQRVLVKNPNLARRMIFLTGDLVNEETKMFLEQTGTSSLEKPFDLKQVERIICNKLKEHSSPDSPDTNSPTTPTRTRSDQSISKLISSHDIQTLTT